MQNAIDAIVVGDGPGGLSAALFLAKGGLKVVVYGQDKTAMHWALLKNYLGIPEMLGSEYQRIAKEQISALGVELVNARVETVAKVRNQYEVALEGGGKGQARFLVLSEGKSPRLAQQLGLTMEANGAVRVDINGKTSQDFVYAVGRLARPDRSQAIISAGDGAAAAIDILSTVKGGPVQDWDSPAESE
jgi:thioredoxin reductase (NADPH)